MKNLIYLLLVLVFLPSCVPHKAIYDSYYKGEANYKRFYVVDSIKIENPVIVWYFGRFVCSRKLIDTVKIDENFFKRPDVFLLCDSWGLYFDLELVDYDKYSYPAYGNCKIELKATLNTELKTKFKIRYKKSIKRYFEEHKVYLYEYETPPAFFILGLINANYYNAKHASDEGWYPIKTKDQKTSYYKIVYPLCE
jgi:hypothetical protein